MNELKNIRGFIRKTILQEYGQEKWLIYKTSIEGINPKHEVVDDASSEEDAKTKVANLEFSNPGGIYFYDKEHAIKLKHSFELNESN